MVDEVTRRHIPEDTNPLSQFPYFICTDDLTVVRGRRSSSAFDAGCCHDLWKQRSIFIKIRPGNNFCQRKPRHLLRFLNSILAHSVGKKYIHHRQQCYQLPAGAPVLLLKCHQYKYKVKFNSSHIC